MGVGETDRKRDRDARPLGMQAWLTESHLFRSEGVRWRNRTWPTKMQAAVATAGAGVGGRRSRAKRHRQGHRHCRTEQPAPDREGCDTEPRHVCAPNAFSWLQSNELALAMYRFPAASTL